MNAPESAMTQIARRMLSAKAEQFTESVIREMTRLALKHNAVNLSQGFPDFAAPAEIKEAARQAISDDINQYAITWGAKPLRDAIVEKFESTQGIRVDPEREITICCGSTEAMMSAMMAIINPGDEIVVFEPFYENYGPDAILSGAGIDASRRDSLGGPRPLIWLSISANLCALSLRDCSVSDLFCVFH